jgi:HNH endonuclease
MANRAGLHNVVSKASGQLADSQGTKLCRHCGVNPVGGRGSRSFCGDLCRFWSKVQKGPTCWLWRAGRHVSKRTKEPYGQCYYKGRPRRAHIVSWALAHGDVPSLDVLHRCDTPLCVRPDHLFLGTQTDNMRDAAAKGRLHVPRPHRQKVSPEQIEVIRNRVAAGETHKAVAPLRPSLEQVG